MKKTLKFEFEENVLVDAKEELKGIVAAKDPQYTAKHTKKIIKNDITKGSGIIQYEFTFDLEDYIKHLIRSSARQNRENKAKKEAIAKIKIDETGLGDA